MNLDPSAITLNRPESLHRANFCPIEEGGIE
jgi:hypothetical protein